MQVTVIYILYGPSAHLRQPLLAANCWKLKSQVIGGLKYLEAEACPPGLDNCEFLATRTSATALQVQLHHPVGTCHRHKTDMETLGSWMTINIAFAEPKA